MKKKIIYLFLVALIIPMLFLFTGCKKKDRTVEETFKIVLPADGSVVVELPANLDLTKVPKNTQVTVKVNVPTDKEVETFKVNNVDQTLTNNKYTFTVTSDITVTVTFKDESVVEEPETFTLTLPYDVTVESPTDLNLTKIVKNTSVTVVAHIPDDKELVEFKVNDVNKTLTSDNKYTFTVTENTTIILITTIKQTPISSFVFKWYEASTDFEEGYSVSSFVGNEKNVIIPSEYEGKPVKYIEPNAFINKDITELVVPKSVLFIFEGALSGCSSLVKLTIPFVGATREIPADATLGKHVSYIFGKTEFDNSYVAQVFGEGSYYLPKSLKEVTVTDGTAINSFAFAGQITEGFVEDLEYNKPLEIEKINLPEGLLTIGQYAFSNTNITSITIPETVTKIGQGVFSFCSNLTNIDIPKNVTTINFPLFFGCSNLVNINIDENNEAFKSVDGVVYSKDEKVIMAYPNGRSGIYNILDGTTTIGDHAFLTASITGVTFPLSLSNIGSYAFAGCPNITNMVIPSHITTFGDFVFTACEDLENVEFPDNITVIPFGIFHNCLSLKNITIPENVTEIKEGAFAISGLTSIVIPNLVTYIGGYAFTLCEDLETVILSNTLVTIDENAFDGCVKLDGVTLPNTLNEILSDAFKNCSSLTEISIPTSVSVIGENAFRGCQALTIICYATSKPEGWHDNWNPDNRPVIWDYENAFCSLTLIDDGTIEILSPTGLNLSRILKGTNINWTINIPETKAVDEIIINDISSEASSSNLYTLEIQEDTTIEVVFINLYSLTLPSDGTVEVIYPLDLNLSKIEDNTTITLKVVNSPSGKVFDEFFINGEPQPLSENLEYTFNITNNTVVNVTFKDQYYTLTLPVDNSVTVESPEGLDINNILKDTEITVKVTVPMNKEISHFKVNGIDQTLTAENKYTFAITQNTTIEVTYIQTSYTLSLPTDNTVTVESPSGLNLNSVPHNTVVTLKVTPQTGNQVTEFLVNGVNKSLTSDYKYIYTATENTTITVTYHPQNYSLTLPTDNTLTVFSPTGLNLASIPAWTEITVKANIPSGLVVEEFTVNGVKKNMTSDGKYTFFLQENTTLTVKFNIPLTPSDQFTFDMIQVNGVQGYGVRTYNGNDAKVRVPSEHNGMPVIAIGYNTFVGKSSMIELVIPNSILEFSFSGVLNGCSNLKKLTVPFIGRSRNEPEGYMTGKITYFFDRSPYTNSYDAGDGFQLPNSLTEVVITDVTFLNVGAIAGDDEGTHYPKIQKVTLPQNLQEIRYDAFKYAKSLTSINIPKSVTSIGSDAFYGCSALPTIYIPSSVTYIGLDTFKGCSSLQIKCQAKSKPAGWNSAWNPDNRPVTWNVTQ